MSDESILEDKAKRFLAVIQPEIDKKVKEHMLNLLIYGQVTTRISNEDGEVTIISGPYLPESKS
jgi:DNA-binding TFAR19-related protein (PDSD5 family)